MKLNPFSQTVWNAQEVVKPLREKMKKLGARDPDGLDLELAWIVPADELDEATLDARTRIRRLDLGKAQERYGRDTQGGIGISR